MSEFYNQLGGLLIWIFVKFCKTKLSDEQSVNNRVRNQLYLYILQILILILIILNYN